MVLRCNQAKGKYKHRFAINVYYENFFKRNCYGNFDKRIGI